MAPALLRRASGILPAALLCFPLHAFAISFSFGPDEQPIDGVLNSTITLGGAWRMQDRAVDLVGKGNLNPGVCGEALQGCQGVFRDQTAPASAIRNSPGQATVNADDGNLNYDKHDLVQGVAKINQDVNLTWGDFGFFARWIYFHDFVNVDFDEYHPNRVTPENVDQTGYDTLERDFVFPLLRPIYFPLDRIYGPGGVVRNKRTDGRVLNQAGTDFQLLDAVLSGKFALPGEYELTAKIGRQTVNWGESTLLVINSINQANPVNANNLYRVGFDISEVFTPVNMLYLSTEPFSGATLETYYQFEWAPVEIPAPGTFLSFLDIGTDNTVDNVAVQFGGQPEDPEGIARPGNNPLTLIAGSSTTVRRLQDNEARDSGQYGIALKYYFENLGTGTEVGLYHMNYHSKLPYASFYAADASCLRREGPHGVDITNGIQFLSTCTDLPINRVLTGRNPDDATDSIIALDTALFQLEYPEDIKLFGVSFNTTVGDFSIQGELAYRPNAPLQVDTEDLAFAAYGPTLSRCHDPNLGCSGSQGGIGLDGSGFGPSDFLDASGNNPYPDTFNAGIVGVPVGLPPELSVLPQGAVLGHIPGSARAFPSFIIPYRGGVVGENAPTDRTRPLDSSNPGYIRGWEEFDTFQYNLGGTYVLGASDQPFGADQIILIGELGATHVPDLPSTDVLQIDGPGTFTHASAGADGTGADGSRRACSTNVSCHVGADGLRFNPTQQVDGFATRFAWGYRLVSLIKYESVAPGISLQPFIIFAHDVEGTAPGPAENFVEGRKNILVNLETRYKESVSWTVGYGWWTGGAEHNLYRDRDFAQTFVKYQF